MNRGPLGSLVVLTDRRQARQADHDVIEVSAMVAESGAGALVVREKDLPRDERRHLAVAIADRLAPMSTRVVVASDVGLARLVGAHGAHLAADDPWPDAESARGLVLGRSCHDAEEVRAAGDRAGYVTVSPVFSSRSKPGHGPALGVDVALGMVPAEGPAPYALGGIDPDRTEVCIGAGFAGVAVMGAVMGADDPAAVVRDLVAATGIAA